MNRLMRQDSNYFQVRSIKKRKHGKYSVDVHCGKYSTKYMKRIWKLQYEFTDSRIIWFMLKHYSSLFIRSCAFKI